MKRLALLLLLIASPSFSQTACPVQEYERWDMYEEYSQDSPLIIRTAKAMGMYKAFSVIEDDVTLWWAFAVEPKTEVNSIQLVTDRGTYDSELVLFTTWAQKENIPCPAIADPEYENMKIKGKLRVVAFARFPSEPQGNMVTWSIK